LPLFYFITDICRMCFFPAAFLTARHGLIFWLGV
jgi:hypothetical protein